MEDILYDETTQTRMRFISFVGNHGRYDLCLLYSDRFFGKALVLNMLSNRFAIIGNDDLAEEGYIEEAYAITSEEAAELGEFLNNLI